MLGQLQHFVLLFLLLGDGACSPSTWHARVHLSKTVRTKWLGANGSHARGAPGFGGREGAQTPLRADRGLQRGLQNEEKPVFVFATGRSGSTTVMRMLNTIPGAHICGETMGALGFLSAFYEALEKTRAHGDSVYPLNISAKLWAPGEFPAWSNSFKLQDVLRDSRVLVRNLFRRDARDTMWGSKDIRHHCGHSRLLKLLFPHVRIIYPYRQSIEKQKLSAWYSGDQSAATTLAKENADLIKCHQANRDWTFLSNLEGRCFPLKFVLPSPA